MTANSTPPVVVESQDADDDRMVSVRLSREEQSYITGLVRADLSNAPTMPSIPKDGTDAVKLHSEFQAYIEAEAHWRTVEAPKIGLADRIEAAQPRTRITKPKTGAADDGAKESTGADDGAEATK